MRSGFWAIISIAVLYFALSNLSSQAHAAEGHFGVNVDLEADGGNQQQTGATSAELSAGAHAGILPFFRWKKLRIGPVARYGILKQLKNTSAGDLSGTDYAVGAWIGLDFGSGFLNFAYLPIGQHSNSSKTSTGLQQTYEKPKSYLLEVGKRWTNRTDFILVGSLAKYSETTVGPQVSTGSPVFKASTLGIGIRIHLSSR